MNDKCHVCGKIVEGPMTCSSCVVSLMETDWELEHAEFLRFARAVDDLLKRDKVLGYDELQDLLDALRDAGVEL